MFVCNNYIDFLIIISTRVVDANWRELFLMLGVSITKMNEIEHDYQYCTLTEKCYQVFRMWFNENGGFKKTNINKVKDALLDLDLPHIADVLDRQLKEIADFFDKVT